jgi:hypothetical protein
VSRLLNDTGSLPDGKLELELTPLTKRTIFFFRNYRFAIIGQYCRTLMVV